MFNQIDLQALAERQGPQRAFLSLYLSSPEAMQSLDGRIRRVREMLSDDPVEQEHFEENLRLAQEFLADYSFNTEGLCIFACWANDYLQAFELDKELPDLLWVDSSPYLRPLAELQDEYENFVVVTADNTETHIYLVTSAVPDEEERVKGDIKNQVKKGGYSQQRYARRREKNLLHYAKEVADALADLDQHEDFERLFLLGSHETMQEIKEVLPERVAEKLVGMQAVDLHDSDEVWEAAFDMFFKEERASEQTLWERIKGEYLREGRAVTGPEDVLQAAAVGRIEKMIVTRDSKIPGVRCRDCENLSNGERATCPICGSDSIFKVDLVNELVELLAASSAETEFTDPIPGLTKVGDVAALLRY